jgi:transposase-like protein
MNIIDRARAFVDGLRELAQRSAWDWRRCPRCGDTLTCKWGGYTRHPWTFAGRQAVWVQRHRCERCRRTYSEQAAGLVRGSWYAREVQRCALDHWQHVGTSVRRTAEVLRSWLGRQERWLLWRPLDAAPGDREACHLSASTVQRWLNRAGEQARRTVTGQLAGVPTSGQLVTDGLWARLRGGTTRVVLLLVDSVSGLVWPPIVATGEEAPLPWQHLFVRARAAGLDPGELWGVTSDGATGLAGYLRQRLSWVSHQRCVFHLWRNLAGDLAAQTVAATAGLAKRTAAAVRRQVRQELVALVRGVLDAPNERAAWAGWDRLAQHPRGSELAAALRPHVPAALVWRRPYTRQLLRVSPEWCWRDFRLHLSHGRNHGTPARLERAALRWALYHNFTPAQDRRERKRQYRGAGLSPLARAGGPPGAVSYLDALAI